MNFQNLHLLTDEDVLEALRAVKEMQAELEAIKVKRDAVLAAMNEVDDLQASVTTSTYKIKEHLKNAL